MSADEQVLVRTFTADVTQGDGRTIDVRVVPYGVVARVSDEPGFPYDEEWAPGCFDDQLVAGHRLKVLLNFEHLEGVTNVVGKGVSLRSATDGLHGTFRALNTEAGNTALELVTDGILDGVSLEAVPKRGGSIRTAGGVVRRTKAHLVNVALCRTMDGYRKPAFADARVLAVRTEPEYAIEEELLPVPIDPDLVERLRDQGVRLPSRYTTHPAPTGTPDQGTPEAAPVTTTITTATEEP